VVEVDVVLVDVVDVEVVVVDVVVVDVVDVVVDVVLVVLVVVVVVDVVVVVVSNPLPNNMPMKASEAAGVPLGVCSILSSLPSFIDTLCPVKFPDCVVSLTVRAVSTVSSCRVKSL